MDMALVWMTLILLTAVGVNLGAYLKSAPLYQEDHVGAELQHLQCPVSCTCDRFALQCNSEHLHAIPTNISFLVVDMTLFDNDISYLSYHMSLRALVSLDVSFNNISIIDAEWLSSLSSLQILNLSNNILINEKVENVFQSGSLQHLSLANNELNHIKELMFNELTALRSLNLSSNQIHNINCDSFNNLVNLNVLDLSMNNLTDLKHEWFRDLVELRNLSLQGNALIKLGNVVFFTLRNLQYLDLSDNNLKSVGLLSFKGLANLKVLNMSKNSVNNFQEGTFRFLEALVYLDLNENPLLSINNLFLHCQNIRFMYMKNLSRLKELSHNSFLGLSKLELLDLSGSKALSDVHLKAFTDARQLKDLDMSNANLTHLKMGVFSDLKNVQTLKLNGNPFKCDCYMYWLLKWLGTHASTAFLSPSETLCNSPPDLKGISLLDALDHNMVCTDASIQLHTNKTKFKVGLPALLECQVSGVPIPSLTWITPQKETFNWQGRGANNSAVVGNPKINSSLSNGTKDIGRFHLLPNGNLAIQRVERGDGGFYICVASNPLNYASVSIRLTLDYEYLIQIKIVSVLVGLATSFGFLLLTLVFTLVRMIFRHFHIACPCRTGKASPRTQHIKKMLESIEHYKRQQLDRLRDNYTVQVQRIKDNCMQQMERLRESYSSQAERLRDIKEYGTLQIDRMRENYYSQVQRVRDYSASQIIRLRENYMFQRNRIRKFSTHHLYKLRENYKVQQQHLNKILENFNIESCRNVCQRTDSIVFEPELNLDNVLVPKICLQTSFPRDNCDSNDSSSQVSAYFTPDEAASEVSSQENDERESFVNQHEVNMLDDASGPWDLPNFDLDDIVTDFPGNETIV